MQIYFVIFVVNSFCLNQLKTHVRNFSLSYYLKHIEINGDLSCIIHTLIIIIF
jgi:hypothetical protein